ncbi:MAG: hypothetical protein ACTSRW_08375 [Candidatus Helarchaeota archaeon]
MEWKSSSEHYHVIKSIEKLSKYRGLEMCPKEKGPVLEAELYELNVPGSLILKEVMDSKAKRIGVVRCVKLTFPPKVELIIKGLDMEIPIDYKNVSKVGTVIQLKTKIPVAEECDTNEIIRLQEEIKNEMKELYSG